MSAAPGAAPRQVRGSPWEHTYEFRPGKWSATDYAFELPVAGARTIPRQTIVLKRGRGLSLVPGQALADRLALVVLNPAGHPIARYRLSHAFLVKIVGPTLNAGGNDVPIEEIVISHEGISLEWPPPGKSR